MNDAFLLFLWVVTSKKKRHSLYIESARFRKNLSPTDVFPLPLWPETTRYAA